MPWKRLSDRRKALCSVPTRSRGSILLVLPYADDACGKAILIFLARVLKQNCKVHSGWLSAAE